MGVAIYDLVTRVAGLFKQYYEAAINATTYEQLRQAAGFFSRAIIGGLLDILALVAGGSALARIRLLRAQGRLTVSAWVEAMAEWGQQLMRRLRSGGKMLERLINGEKKQPPASPPEPAPAPPPPPVAPVYATAAEELQNIRLQGRPKADIEAELRSKGFSKVTAHSGGDVWTKPMPDGNTASVRIDPAKVRNRPKGYADEVPHAHKEIVPSNKVSNGNYSQGDATTLDESANPSIDRTDTHIPIIW